MRTTGELKTVRVFDRQAVELINERAAREHRSAANAAAITVIEALGNKRNHEPKFLNNIVVKNTSSEAKCQAEIQ